MKIQHKKQATLVFCCAIAFLFLAFDQTVHAASAWEAEWERTVKAAEQEGELSYYTVGEFNFLSEFEKKFPRVKVKVVQGRGNELLVRIMTERRAGKYLADVARIGNTSPYSLHQAKTLQPIAAGVHFARSQRRVEMVVGQASIHRHGGQIYLRSRGQRLGKYGRAQ